MTEYVFKATIDESDAIAKGLKRFMFRSKDYPIGFGDMFTVQTYKNSKMTRHAIEKMKFVVTYVDASAPIEQGFQVIGFDRLGGERK